MARLDRPEPSEVLAAVFADPATPPGPLQPQTEMVLAMYATFPDTGVFQIR